MTGPRADCAMDGNGRLTLELDLPAARDPRLLLRLRPKKGQEPADTDDRLIQVPLAPAGRDGRWRAVLAPHDHVLAEGRWDVYALDAATDEPRRRVLPGVRDLRGLLDQRPDPGVTPLAVRIPYPTKDRYLAVRAWLRPAHAEAGEIRIADDTLTVRARLLGAALGPGAKALVRRRGKDSVLHEAAVRDEGGGAFSFAVDYRVLARDRAREQHFWDLYVRPEEGGARVRIGRLLDDVADKKQIFTYPATTVGGAVIRPYYTVDNDLSVDVTAAPAGEDTV